jgi:hypothetical protein
MKAEDDFTRLRRHLMFDTEVVSGGDNGGARETHSATFGEAAGGDRVGDDAGLGIPDRVLVAIAPPDSAWRRAAEQPSSRASQRTPRSTVGSL